MKLLATASALVLVCAACSAGSGSDGLEAADSPVARYDWTPGSGGAAALMEGTLELRDGCLYIVGSGNTAGLTTVPVLSRELASWDAESSVLTYADADYAVGDQVAAGGGWSKPSDSMTVPEQCEPDEWGEVMYVQDTTLAPLNARG